MRAMVSEPPCFGASLVAGVPPVLLEPELSSLLDPPQPATTAAAAKASRPVVLRTRMFPSSGRTTGAGVAHCVQHTGLDVTSRRLVVGPFRTGGPQAAVADGGRLARPAHRQRREPARGAAHRAAAGRAGGGQPLARARGAAHPRPRGGGGGHPPPWRAGPAPPGAGRGRAGR